MVTMCYIVVTRYNCIEWDNCKDMGNGSKYDLLNVVNVVYQKLHTT